MRKILFLLITMSIITTCRAVMIDDFEDGIINTDRWCTLQGALYPGYEEQGWGEVYERDGKLTLTSFDQGDGAGVAVAVLKQMYLDVHVRFSFEATIYDITPGGPYSPHIEFMIIDNGNIDNWLGQGYHNKIVYAIEHDLQHNPTQVSGLYDYYFDSTTKEARIYDASNNVPLGSVSYADFSSGPYICFEAYTDSNGGYITETISINEIYTVPEPATLLLLGIGGLFIRKRQ